MSRLDYVFFLKSEGVQQVNLAKVEDKLIRLEAILDCVDINSVIEFYEIKSYFDARIYLKSWTEEEIEYYKEKIKKIDCICNDFLLKINSENFNKIYTRIETFYLERFWNLLANRCIYKKINKDVFVALLRCIKNVDVVYILKQEKIVKYFSLELRDYFFNNIDSAEILLYRYVAKDDYYRNVYIPKSLSLEDREKLLSNYIDSDVVNINFLRLITKMQDTNDLKISVELKLKAIKRAQKENDAILEKNGIEYKLQVGFYDELGQPVDYKFDSESFVFSVKYNKTLFNNTEDVDYFYKFFLSLNTFIDWEGRIALINRDEDKSILDLCGIELKKGYFMSSVAQFRNKLSFCTIYAYNEELKRNNKSIEYIFDKIFTSCFDVEYGIENLSISMPSAKFYSERIKVLLPDIESLLKKYNLYVKSKEIDVELLKISSQPIRINDIVSLCDIKNVYLVDNDFTKKVTYLLFSKGSMLFNAKKYGFISLFDCMMTYENVGVDDISLYGQGDINFLLENGYLSLKDNVLTLENLEEIVILKDLHKYGYICFPACSVSFQQIMSQMEKNGLVVFDDKLFSKQEADYFNFYLNQTFSNGLDIRNKYLHGVNHLAEKEHEKYYFVILKLLVLIFLKIRFDLFYYHKH